MKYCSEIEKLYFEKTMRIQNFEPIDNAYLFTTEDIKGYMPDLQEKNVLTVSGSGDQYFNALLKGAKTVDLFDINYLSKIIVTLKKCGFEHLDYDVFCTFFGLSDLHRIFDYGIYQQLRKYLDDESIIHWDYIYELTQKDGYSIYTSPLIGPFHDRQKDVFHSNLYLNEENYLKLKKILSAISDITFYHSDIKDLPLILKKKYDTMFFSNINTYQKQFFYLKIMKKMRNFLEEKGEMYFAYVYNSNISEQGAFFDTLLKNPHYSSKKLSVNTEDKVYIYKK